MYDRTSSQGSFTSASKSEKQSNPVECLGRTFPNDEERRKYFTDRLREKLKDPAFRKIEGFPIGSDTDILALSDPPYYTACPNPFIEEFVGVYGKPYNQSMLYTKEPFAVDVTEGKRDPLYEHYSYHTKVPPRAIMRYIEHYTQPGDIILDGFSGSGMTGVATKIANKDGGKSNERYALLCDLSVYATFIGHHFNKLDYPPQLESEFQKVEKQYEWMYKTKHSDGSLRDVNYYVWSDVFLCPDCGKEIVFFSEFVDDSSGEVKDTSNCPWCSARITKSSLEPCWTSIYDKLIGHTSTVLKQQMVLVRYFIGNSQHEKIPDEYDREILKRVTEYDAPFWIPTYKLPEGDNTSQPIRSHGITHSHMFFTKRNLIAISALWDTAHRFKSTFWMFELLGGFRVWTRRSIFLTSAWKQGGTGAFKPSTSGILYMPSLSGERNVLYSFRERRKESYKFWELLPKQNVPCISTTGSCTDLGLVPSNAVDYAFIDPPFGGNIMYSELNMVYEPWLKVITSSPSEAICNSTQNKTIAFYARQMAASFKEIHRILKPGRWVTIEFHNSKNSIWNAIQESLQEAGFTIADIRTLDKKQGTFKQYTSVNIAKQDLIISAYKPSFSLEEKFKLEAGIEAGAWDFIREHLRQLPVFVGKNGQAEAIAERQAYMLYDRMVAFHVQHGVLVPLSAAEFYAGLAQKFPERDGMFFLPEQATQYDKKRMTVKEFQQLTLIVKDESSAVLWLRQSLYEKPQTFQELHPQFMREIGGWQKFEKPLELREMLEENFLCYDGTGDIASQVHSYLSTNFHELRGLTKDNPILKAKAKDRWYVPDPNKSIDLEKLRERSLLKEFQDYVQSTQKRLKVFRLEAVRAGFKRAWAEADYRTIVMVAEKLPAIVLEEDQMLLMWYSNAQTRLGEKLI